MTLSTRSVVAEFHEKDFTRRLREERSLAVIRLVGAGLGALYLETWVPEFQVRGLSGVMLGWIGVLWILAVGSVGLTMLYRPTTRRLEIVRRGANVADHVTLISQAWLYATYEISTPELILFILPLVTAMRFGVRAARWSGLVTLAALAAKPLLRVLVFEIPAGFEDTRYMLLPLLIVTSVSVAAARTLSSETAELRATHRQLAELYGIVSGGLTELGDLDLRSWVDATRRRLDLEALAVLRVHESDLSIAAVSGMAAPEGELPIDDDGPIRTCLRTGRTTVARAADLVEVATLGRDTETVVAIPIAHFGTVFGAIVVEHPHVLVEDAIRDLERVADALSLVLRVERSFEARAEVTEHFRELDRLKERFITIFSHEVRTPLTSLVGFAEMLATRDLDPAMTRSAAESLRRNAGRLASTVDKLDQLAAIQADAVVVKPHAVRLVEVLSHVASTVDARVVTTGDPDVVVWVDDRHLHRVLTEVLANVDDHGGATAAVSWLLTDGALLIRFEDDGPGFPSGLEREMFRPFERATELLSHQRGTGLGLPLARGLAERLGGSLDVIVGDGPTAVELVLPLPPTTGAAVTISGDGYGPRTLVTAEIA